MWLREDSHNLKNQKKREEEKVVDNFDEEIIKRTTHRLLDCKEALTIKTSKTYLEKNNGIHISKNRLWRSVRDSNIYVAEASFVRNLI